MNKTIILTALPTEIETELDKILKICDVYYTGVGKINAAFKTATILQQTKATKVINYGTAASLSNRGKLIECSSFFQYDMDATGLGFPKMWTPFDEDNSYCLKFNTSNENNCCYTSDTFRTDNNNDKAIFDMEAYAIAKVCKSFNINNFISYKYISDSGNDTSANDWKENCKLGATLFLERLMTL